MPDISAVSAILSSIKTATDIAKLFKETGISLDKAEEKLRLADLIGALADAKIQIAEVKDLLLEKDSCIRELEQQLVELRRNEEIISTLKYDPPFYVNEEGSELYCARCIESDRRPIHLTKTVEVRMRRRIWVCQQCKRDYADTRERSSA